MDNSITLEHIGLFIHLAGFVIGMGAVTVIDIHGFLGRKSLYWTVATTRTHKVTKPLIWIGIFLVILGGIIVNKDMLTSWHVVIQALIVLILIINGLFLSFSVSPFLIAEEKAGKESLLSPSWQHKITASFIVSLLGWWSLLCITTFTLAERIGIS